MDAGDGCLAPQIAPLDGVLTVRLAGSRVPLHTVPPSLAAELLADQATLGHIPRPDLLRFPVERYPSLPETRKLARKLNDEAERAGRGRPFTEWWARGMAMYERRQVHFPMVALCTTCGAHYRIDQPQGMEKVAAHAKDSGHGDHPPKGKAAWELRQVFPWDKLCKDTTIAVGGRILRTAEEAREEARGAGGR